MEILADLAWGDLVPESHTASVGDERDDGSAPDE
jgi:hypothetical protein